MNYKERKLVHILHYLMSHCSEAVCDKVHLLKLIWMADRYHLRKFGSMMINAKYHAYPNGPVNQDAYEMLKRFDQTDDLNFKDYIVSIPPSPENGSVHTRYQTNGAIEYHCLSKSNVEALTVAIDKMADLSAKKIDVSEFSHGFPEWESVKDMINAESKLFPRIHIVDFFGKPTNSEDEFCSGIPEALVGLNKEIVLEA